MRKLFLLVILALPASAVTIDRVAAVIDQQVIAVSEIDQMVATRFFARTAGQSEDDYRHAVLDNLIAQALRYRDVERFTPQEISKDSIESRLQEIQKRFASPAEFEGALQKSELSLDEFRALIKRQLQVEAYIQERFAPLVFIPNEDIDAYYRSTWVQQRRARGLRVQPLSEVREEIRALLRSDRLTKEIDTWTTQLRGRANVDVYAWR